MNNLIRALVVTAQASNWAYHYLMGTGMSRKDAEFICWLCTAPGSKLMTGNIKLTIQYLNLLED